MAKSSQSLPWLRLGVAAGVFALILISAMATIIGMHYHTWTQRPLLVAGESVTLNIKRGASWESVVNLVEERGLVGEPLYFDIWGRNRGLPVDLKAGQYALDGPLTLEELDELLRKGGAADELTITLPEGYSIFHMADAFDESGLIDRQAFLDAARNPDLLAQHGVNATSFEGFLFPDTYRFQKGTPAESIIARMHNRFDEVWSEVVAKHADSKRRLEGIYALDALGFVTLASLIEKESGVASEREIISRVFYNRFDRNMKLQTDPTCVYGPTTYRDVPSPKTCKDPLNRYSTYVIQGLPPGPIANPGRASLEAAVAPSDEPGNAKVLFFVARRDGSGGHHFSETFREHRRAINKFLKSR